jgi:hypothetical protein
VTPGWVPRLPPCHTPAMSTLAGLQLLAIVVLVGSTLETFRARPWWPRPVGRGPDRPPPRGSAPRQRRWLHAGLAVVLAGNVLSMQRADDQTALVVAVTLVLVGLALVVVGLVLRPTPEELARYDAEVREP